MASYKLPVDVGNRALQHLKKPRITSFTSNAQGANELGFAYDKIRQYELQRNLWVFATREAVVRPVRNDTMLLQPALWSATLAYPVGAIVAFPQGSFWIANSRVAPGGLAPGNTTVDLNGNLVWDSYYGPMTAERYHPTGQSDSDDTDSDIGNQDILSGYNGGELVYIPKGDGTAVIYQCVRDTDHGPLHIRAWDDDHFYKKGDIAGYQNDSPNQDSGLFELGSSDLGGPDVLGTMPYISTADLNVGNDPTLTNAAAPQPTWDPNTQWLATAYVIGSDNQIYLCLQNSQGDANLVPGALGYNPVTDYGQVYWQPLKMFNGMWSQAVPTGIALNNDWQMITATLTPITIPWPAGSGPAEDTFNLNVFKLPANWLRLAPDNPKTGITPWLGGPTFVPERDWTFYGNDWLVSSEVRPIKLRYIADFQDVSQMDVMFAEALALTLALECAAACDGEDQIAAVSRQYRTIVGDARQVNAIEVGPVTPPDCRLISVRY